MDLKHVKQKRSSYVSKWKWGNTMFCQIFVTHPYLRPIRFLRLSALIKLHFSPMYNKSDIAFWKYHINLNSRTSKDIERIRAGFAICTGVSVENLCVHWRLVPEKACVHPCESICVGCACALLEDVINNNALIVSLWSISLPYSH